MNQDALQRLRDILVAQEKNHEPWTTGVVELTKAEQTIFFKCKDGSSRHIDLGSIKEEDIKALVDACEPAPFGRGPESVLDDTYRKAWKLDAGDFGWLFNPESGSFIAQLAQGLCPWDRFDRGISVEITKLNVYEKGGFFKTHKDTPRGENMFGSLVFVLPTEHQGGNLVLRHRERELNFDATTLLKGSPPGSVAYIAFYSDVDHEVLEVISGHRATITFNLYFDSMKAPPILPSNRLKVPENPFILALRELFQNTAFIEKHEYLGFGLEYSYPEGTQNEYNLAYHLKGPDAFLYRVLSELGAKPKLIYLYESWDEGNCGFWALRKNRITGRRVDHALSDTELDYIMEEEGGGIIVWKRGESEETVMDKFGGHPWIDAYFDDVKHYKSRTMSIDWVTPPYSNLAGMTEYTEWGNEPNEEIFYFRVCIVVDTSDIKLEV